MIVATNLFAISEDEKKYDLLSPRRFDYQRWKEIRFEEIRFIATNSRSIVKDGKIYDLMPPIFAWLTKMERNTIWSHKIVLHCQIWQDENFIVANLCSVFKDGKKYDLLSPICIWFIKDGKKHELLPPIWDSFTYHGKKNIPLQPMYIWLSKNEIKTNYAWLSRIGNNTIYCHLFDLDY